jgi:hypothetical protein
VTHRRCPLVGRQLPVAGCRPPASRWRLRAFGRLLRAVG